MPEVMCQEEQIRRVLIQLLTNAREALNERAPDAEDDRRITITGRAIVKDGRTWVRTTVEDTGVGIAEDFRGHVFDPFATTKDRAVHAGLGLSISHGIVQEHGGGVTVESELGQWTRFHVDLPAEEEA